MKIAYAPWRHKYVTEELPGRRNDSSPQTCVFCTQFAQDKDRDNLILKRLEHSVVVMNKYPYNAGHLMVLPRAHKAELFDLDEVERNEIFSVTTDAIEITKKILKPHGFNIGINLGSAGGGGIPSHMHVHILPRWNGDTNFLPLLAETKVVCSDFWEVYDLFKAEFDK